jgi:hypothetical protein
MGMKINKVGFVETFPVGDKWQKVIMEAELVEGDDPRKCLYELKRQVEDFFYESNGAAKKQGVVAESNRFITEPPPYEEQKPFDIIEAINSCTDPKVLESYRLLANKNTEHRTIYLTKMIELTNK